MCTVTVVPAGDAAFRLVANRDERLTRPAAEPPRLHRLGRRTAIYPIDPAGGGTWVGVNDAGLAAALLNRSSGSRSAGLQPCPLSRGAIVPLCLESCDLARALKIVRGLALDQFALFSLVLVDRRRVAVATSDGGALRIERSTLTAPVLFTSSSLGDGLVDWPRRQLFEQVLGSDRAAWLDRQTLFHQHQWPEHPEISVRMQRQDAATVSQSIVDVTPRSIRFRYERVAWGVQVAA